MSSRGQSLVETLLSIPLLLACLGIGLKLLFVGFKNLATEEILYECSLCVLESRDTSLCKDRSENKLKSIIKSAENIIATRDGRKSECQIKEKYHRISESHLRRALL